MTTTPDRRTAGQRPTGEATTAIPDPLRRSTLHQTYMERIADGRDMRVIITADNAATGVGKTTLAVYLAKLWDIWGWEPAKGTLDPREYTVMYDNVPPVTVLLLDEAEQALERRRSMSDEVLAVGHDFATKRYRQVIGLLTLPSKSMMDARIADTLCDFWILVQETGEATVFRFDENAFTGEVYYKKVEQFGWPPLDDDADFRAIERKKHEWMTGQTKSRFVSREEFERAKDNFWRKAEARTTYDFVTTAYDVFGPDGQADKTLTQSEIGQIVGMSQGNVSKITRSDAFEDFYKSFKESNMATTSA